MNDGYDGMIEFNDLPVVGGFEPPLWKMMEFVSWDDEIPNIIGK